MSNIKIEAPWFKEGGVRCDLSDHQPIVIEAAQLKVISYNLQLMHAIIPNPSGINKSQEYIEHQITAVVDYFDSHQADVCCVQELFDKAADKYFTQKMLERGYAASDRLGADWLAFFNGGVKVFIKQPYTDLTETPHIYQSKIDYLIGADAWANKGAMQLSFTKNGKKHHVFNTHLQAYYPEWDRMHYVEITLEQCVELKKIIEQQVADGVIGPDDEVLLCGDFNIPKPHEGEEATLAYQKMVRILGPRFDLLGYERPGEGQIQYTRDHSNTHNLHEASRPDNNVNLDLGILVFPKEVPQALSDLSKIYCALQEDITFFVRKQATILSFWLLLEEPTKELTAFNAAFKALMDKEDELRGRGQDPLVDDSWKSDWRALENSLKDANSKKMILKKVIMDSYRILTSKTSLIALSTSLFLLLPPGSQVVIGFFVGIIYLGVLLARAISQSNVSIKNCLSALFTSRSNQEDSALSSMTLQVV